MGTDRKTETQTQTFTALFILVGKDQACEGGEILFSKKYFLQKDG